MHYYQFNIADYRKDTQHLTPIEHYIYRELMDWYYLDETAIPTETERVTRRLRLGSENNPEVISVLQEYFIETVEGWGHGRIEREISTYHTKAETARVNGSKGGRPKKPRKTKAVNLANPEKSKRLANQEPLTNNHKPINKGNGRFAPPSLIDIKRFIKDNNYSVSADAFIAHYESNGWKVGKNKMKDWQAALRGWETRDKSSGTVKPVYGANAI